MPTSEQKEEEKLNSLKSLYQISIETRNFEINQLIQRNNFFMLFQGVLLAAITQSEVSKPYVEVTICIIGIFVSFYQMQVASGAKYWQEWWESRVDYFEKLLCEEIKDRVPYNLFTTSDTEQAVRNNLTKGKNFTNYLILRNFSIGRAPIKVSIVLLIAWTTLLATTLDFSTLQEILPKRFFVGFDFAKSQ